MDVEVTCTINMEAEHVDDLKTGDVFHNHKAYKVSVPVEMEDSTTLHRRLESYIINFMKKKESEPFRFLPQVICDFE